MGGFVHFQSAVAVVGEEEIVNPVLVFIRLAVWLPWWWLCLGAVLVVVGGGMAVAGAVVAIVSVICRVGVSGCGCVVMVGVRVGGRSGLMLHPLIGQGVGRADVKVCNVPLLACCCTGWVPASKTR